MGALIGVLVIAVTLCACETVIKRFPRLEARIDRFLGGDGTL